MSAQLRCVTLQKRILKLYRLVDFEKQRYECLVDNCGKNIGGRKPSNLTGHVKRLHADFFKTNFGELCQIEKKQPFAYRRLQHIQRCVEIVGVNGNPFTKLKESGIDGLLCGERNVLNTFGYGSGLFSPKFTAIKNQIKYLSTQIQQQIKDEVRGKFVSVMVDSASKHNRSILGVCIQYILDGEIKIRTIAMKNLTQSQTAEHLKDVVIARLLQYGINKPQIVSITTDNANSMLAMVKLMNDDSVDSDSVIDDEDDDIDEATESDGADSGDDEEDDDYDGNDASNKLTAGFGFDLDSDDINEDLSVPSFDVDDDMDIVERREEVNEILNENAEYDELLQDLEQRFSAHSFNINGVRCAAHTIQLCIRDSLTVPIMKIIRRCRAVIKTLRLKKIQFELRKNNIQIILPRSDCITRWDSTYRMVSIDVQSIVYNTHLMFTIYIQ